MSRFRILIGLGMILALASGILVGVWLITGSQKPSGTAAGRGVTHRPAAVSTVFPVGAGNPDLSGKVRPPGNGSPSPVPPGVDGCDRNYADAHGERDVCVPPVTPEGDPVDCSFLRRVGFPPLVVVGTDEKNLAGEGRPAARGETVCAD